MRLRLRIQRNELPAVSTLWPISESELKHTIAQLLEKVDSRFPLEADHFGLEDYSATLGGYELLHYHEIGTVCKDEDEILIRPLQTAEVRARTLLGRDQINPDGRHLRDGIPFGRPMLRQPSRPSLAIPPLRNTKSNKLLNSPPKRNQNLPHHLTAEENELLRTLDLKKSEYVASNGPIDADDAFHLEMFRQIVENGQLDEFNNMGDEEDDDTFSTVKQLGGIGRTNRLLKEREDSEDDEEDGDFDPSLDDDPSDDEIEDDEQADNMAKALFKEFGVDDEDEDEDDGDFEDNNNDKAKDNSSPASSDDSDESSSDDSDSSSDVSDSSSDVSDDSEVSWQGIESPKKASPQKSATPNKPTKRTPPGEGLRRTKARNQRKAQQNKLRQLKKNNMLPADADMAALEAYEAGSKGINSKDVNKDDTSEVDALIENLGAAGNVNMDLVTDAEPSAQQTGPVSDSAVSEDAQTAKTKKAKKKQSRQDTQREQEHNPLEQMTNGGTLEERQQALLDAIASGGVDVTNEPTPNKKKRKQAALLEEEAPEEMSSRRSTPSANANVDTTPNATDNSSTKRRNRLDMAGTQRLLFGSLGVRVPKSEQDRLATQQKLAGRAGRNANAASSPSTAPKPAATAPEVPVEPEAEDEDPEAWRQKINLRAVECFDEGVALSEPPFPFVQFWDPQYKIVKKKKRTSGASKASGKRRKTGAATGEYVETYDKYNQDGTGDGLDYDDPIDDEEEMDDSYWEEGALMGDDLEEEGSSERASEQLRREAFSNKIKDDFPQLPDDVKTLPLLAATDAKSNDFVVYVEMTMSAETNWSPTYAVRTVKLVEERADKGEWLAQRALRDMPVKQYDEDGKRVYGKFEMEEMSDDGNAEEDERQVVVKWDLILEPRLLQREAEPTT